MKKGDIGDIFFIIRPYLSDAKGMKLFLEENMGLSKEELADKVKVKVKQLGGLEKTDFHILLNALSKTRKSE
ncbi:MAG: hypothetical protein ACXQTP_05830 [Candidatus Methanofastidiosia archaeon]